MEISQEEARSYELYTALTNKHYPALDSAHRRAFISAECLCLPDACVTMLFYMLLVPSTPIEVVDDFLWAVGARLFETDLYNGIWTAVESRTVHGRQLALLLRDHSHTCTVDLAHYDDLLFRTMLHGKGQPRQTLSQAEWIHDTLLVRHPPCLEYALPQRQVPTERADAVVEWLCQLQEKKGIEARFLTDASLCRLRYEGKRPWALAVYRASLHHATSYNPGKVL